VTHPTPAEVAAAGDAAAAAVIEQRTAAWKASSGGQDRMPDRVRWQIEHRAEIARAAAVDAAITSAKETK
jgi:hypothetical protein